jgi:hypothetical protein
MVRRFPEIALAMITAFALAPAARAADAPACAAPLRRRARASSAKGWARREAARETIGESP